MNWKQTQICPKHWVSDCGQVWKKINDRHPDRVQWTRRKTKIDKGGYARINILGKDFLVHRLVYSMFAGPLDPQLQICHINGKPSDNRVSNLLQADAKTNAYHRDLHNTTSKDKNPRKGHKGERNHRSKHTQGQADKIRADLKNAAYQPCGRIGHGELKRIADKNSVKRSFVNTIRQGGWL